MSDTDPETDSLNTTPPIVDSIIQDDSEDEVFFGKVSEKEQIGKNSKFNRRRTLTISDSDRRRSFEVPQGGNRSSSRGLFSLQDSLGSSRSGSRGIFSLQDSLGSSRSGSRGIFSLQDTLGSSRSGSRGLFSLQDSLGSSRSDSRGLFSLQDSLGSSRSGSRGLFSLQDSLGSSRSGSRGLFSLQDSLGSSKSGSRGLFSLQYTLGSSRSGSRGLFSLQDSLGSRSSSFSEDQSLVDKRGMDDVFTFNESLEQDFSTRGNNDNVPNLGLEENMEVSGKIILSKNEDMFEHKMVQNNSEIDDSINENVCLDKQIAQDGESNLANKVILKSKLSVHTESLSTDSHSIVNGRHQPLLSENIDHDAVHSSIESLPAESFKSMVQEKLAVSEGSMSTFIGLPLSKENLTTESSETITRDLPVISENSSIDSLQHSLEEKSSSGSNITISERLYTDSGSIIKEISSIDECLPPKVHEPVPKESSSTTSHLPISSETSLIDNDQVFSEDSVAPKSITSISGEESSPDCSEPLLKNKTFANPPLGELNNDLSSECPRLAFIDRMSTDFVPPPSGEIVSTAEFQLSFYGDSTDPSCSLSKKDVSRDGFQSNPDENLSIDSIPPISSESQHTNDSQPNDQGRLSTKVSFQENLLTDCRPPSSCESLPTDNFQTKGEESCTDSLSKSVVESLSTEEVSSVSSEGLLANDSQPNNQGSLTNVSFKKNIEENFSMDCAPLTPCESVLTDNFQSIGYKEIVCTDSRSKAVVEENLSTEEVPSVPSADLPGDGFQPKCEKILCADSLSKSIIKENLSTEDVPSVSSEGLPADNFQPIAKESLSTDFLPQISNASLSSNNMPPAIKVYLTDSEPSDTSGSGVTPTSEVSQSDNKERSLFNSSKNSPDECFPIDHSPLITRHSTNDLQLEINDVTEPRNDTQDNLSTGNISGKELSDGLSSTTLDISYKVSHSFGSTLEIERNGSHSVTNHLKVSSTNFSDISRSSQSGTAATFIEPLEEPSGATNSSSLSLSDKSLLVSNGANNFLSSTSDGQNLSSPNTIAFGLSPQSRERIYSLMDDSNAALSCDDTVFSDDSCDDFVKDDSFKQSNHSMDEDTDSLTRNDQDKDNLNDNVSHSEHVGEDTSDYDKFAQPGFPDNSKKGDFSVDKVFSTVALSSPDMKDDLEEINKDKNSKEDEILENLSHEEILDYEENKDDDGENCLEEILDVDNTQLFDDSLFSMNDDNSRRLSTIGLKICKKWKKKEKKAKQKNKCPCAIEENNEDLDTMKDHSKTSPNLRDGALGEDSPQFDSTADEMALYEMFGQDYDKTVDDMTVGEKKELREKLNSRTEEDMQLTRSNLSILIDVSLPVSPDLDLSLPISPNLHNVCLDVNNSVTTVVTDNFTDELILPKKSPSQENNVFIEKHCFLQPDFSTKTTTKSPTDSQSHVGSHNKRVTPSPPNSKSSPWRSASPMRKSFIPTPINSGPRTRTPQLSGSAVRTPGSSANTKLGATRSFQVDVNPSPLLGTHLRPGVGVHPSPLATYLRDNKPPPLVHQVKAQSAVRDLESTLTEVDNESAEYACPLPEAVYVAPSLAKEHVTDATNKDYNIAEAYGQTNTLATVTRHVGRVKTGGIHWGEELATDQSLMSSPSQCQMLPVGKSVLKKTQRDSGTFDESMVDMSVLETVAVKKIGRGKNKRTK